MRNLLKISGLGLVSALAPLSLMADVGAGKSAGCDAGFYAGAELAFVATKNRFKNKNDKDKNAGNGKFGAVIDAASESEEDAEFNAASEAAAEGSIANVNDTYAVKSGGKVLVATLDEDNDVVDLNQADAAEALAALKSTAGLSDVTSIVAYGSSEGLDAFKTAAKAKIGSGPADFSGVVGLGNLPEGVRAYANPQYWGGGLIVGYQMPISNGFTGALELNGGWTGGSYKPTDLDNNSALNDRVEKISGGYYIRGLAWGRYALTAQSTIGLGLGVTFRQQRLHLGKDDNNNDNRYNINTTHFTVGGELAAAPASMPNLVPFFRVIYDVPASKNDITRKNRDNDNKDKNNRESLGTRVNTQAFTFSVGFKYLF